MSEPIRGSESAVSVCHFSPRTARYERTDPEEHFARPLAQGRRDERVGALLAELGPERLQHRHEHLGLHLDLIEERDLGIDDDVHATVLPS